MVDPRRVFELGIHHVSRSSGDGDCPVLHVDPRDAYVRHYRQCVRDFDAQMDCRRQCLDDELAASLRIVFVRRRTRRIIESLLHRSSIAFWLWSDISVRYLAKVPFTDRSTTSTRSTKRHKNSTLTPRSCVTQVS